MKADSLLYQGEPIVMRDFHFIFNMLDIGGLQLLMNMIPNTMRYIIEY